MEALLKQNNLIATNSLSIFNEIVEQAHHDMQSPIASIKSIIESIGEVSAIERKVLNTALNRLSEIVKHIAVMDSRDSASSEKVTFINSTDFIAGVESIVNEKKLLHLSKPNLEISFINLFNKAFFVKVKKNDFLRSLSNLIDNSIDASNENGKIKVITEIIGGEVITRVIDLGEGICTRVLRKLGARGATYNKQSGKGLGLYYTKKMIESIGGVMQITSIKGKGTEVTLKMNANLVDQDSFYQYVLIDNDELVRLTWEVKARFLGISLLSLGAPELLVNYLDKISKTQTQIYIDSVLDNCVRGEFVAKALHEKGYQQLYMTTGFESTRFNNYKFLQCIGKQPPFSALS